MVVEEIIHEEIDVSLEDNLEDDDDVSYEYLGTISKIFSLFQMKFKYVAVCKLFLALEFKSKQDSRHSSPKQDVQEGQRISKRAPNKLT